MIALLQRVSQASVTVGGEQLAAIGPGVLALIGVQRHDTEQQADRLLHKILGYRLFTDAQGKMNLSLRDTGGGLLLVPQFTLAANTGQGMRPGFSTAATPEQGRALFDYLLQQACGQHAGVGNGRFGADMQVALVNDGPVTFWLQVAPTPING